MTNYIRFMTEEMANFALWGDSEDLEHTLPITENLRDEILAWAREYQAFLYDGARLDVVEFEHRGRALAGELQAQLGPEYFVEYMLTFKTDSK